MVPLGIKASSSGVSLPIGTRMRHYRGGRPVLPAEEPSISPSASARRPSAMSGARAGSSAGIPPVLAASRNRSSWPLTSWLRPGAGPRWQQQWSRPERSSRTFSDRRAPAVVASAQSRGPAQAPGVFQMQSRHRTRHQAPECRPNRARPTRDTPAKTCRRTSWEKRRVPSRPLLGATGHQCCREPHRRHSPVSGGSRRGDVLGRRTCRWRRAPRAQRTAEQCANRVSRLVGLVLAVALGQRAVPPW